MKSPNEQSKGFASNYFNGEGSADFDLEHLGVDMREQGPKWSDDPRSWGFHPGSPAVRGGRVPCPSRFQWLSLHGKKSRLDVDSGYIESCFRGNLARIWIEMNQYCKFSIPFLFAFLAHLQLFPSLTNPGFQFAAVCAKFCSLFLPWCKDAVVCPYT